MLFRSAGILAGLANESERRQAVRENTWDVHGDWSDEAMAQLPSGQGQPIPEGWPRFRVSYTVTASHPNQPADAPKDDDE